MAMTPKQVAADEKRERERQEGLLGQKRGRKPKKKKKEDDGDSDFDDHGVADRFQDDSDGGAEGCQDSDDDRKMLRRRDNADVSSSEHSEQEELSEGDEIANAPIEDNLSDNAKQIAKLANKRDKKNKLSPKAEEISEKFEDDGSLSDGLASIFDESEDDEFAKQSKRPKYK